MSEINYDDPTTWPDKLEELEALANGEKPDDDTLMASQVFDPVAVTDPVDPATLYGQTDPVDPAEIPQSETAHEDPVKELAEGDATAVLTKDGANLLPFKVVADLRDENKNLRAQLEAIQKPVSTDPAAEQAVANAPIWLQSQQAIDIYIDAIREEYGDVIAEMKRETIDTKRDLAIIQNREAEAVQQAQATKASDVQAAIDKHPLMKAWQSDQNEEWYTKANATYKTLAEHDPSFAALPVEDRIALVAERTEAMFGKSPHSARVAPPTAKPAAAGKAAEHFAPRVPTSMSEMPGGTPAAIDTTDAYDKMSANQLTHHLMSLTPAQFAREMARVS